jgi:hypothetical protein
MTDPRLEALRAAGAHHHDPARFHYLEVLARRLPGQPPAVQRLLAHKLESALARYTQNPPRTKPSIGHQSHANPNSPLARLNQSLGIPQPSTAGGDPFVVDSAPLPALKSAHQFSKAWSHIAAEQQVVQALHRGPENAGPLNAHKLVLRSLSLMRSLSPDYLRHFMAQMDTLLWLDQASHKAPSPATRAARKARSKP